MQEPTKITAEPAHPIASVVIGLLAFVLVCLLAVAIGTTPPSEHRPLVGVSAVSHAAQTVPIPIPALEHR
jgi:hypothetical protein